LHPKPVRVVLVDMSRLTREIIRRILEEQPGIEVVREVEDGARSLRQLVDESEAEVMIVPSEAEDLVVQCRAMLGERGPRQVIAISADGRAAHLYGVHPYEALAEEFSPEFVVHAVRNS
jgi:DNA-binding NarL/FixJ family response regulator